MKAWEYAEMVKKQKKLMKLGSRANAVSDEELRRCVSVSCAMPGRAVVVLMALVCVCRGCRQWCAPLLQARDAR